MRIGAIFLSFLLVPFAALAEGTSTRTGFVDGPVWFSEESLKVDQTVKIYTAIFNGEDTKLTLKVDFIDGTTALSSKEVFVSPNETKTVSTDWKVSLGSHNVYAAITSPKVNGENVLLQRSETGSVKFSVTKDVPGTAVKNALTGKFGDIFSGEGDFMEKADSWFKMNFKKSEEFREKTLENIKASKEKVAKTREDQKKDAKMRDKAVLSAHFYVLAFIGFIFSVSVVFYICAVILIYLALRTIWRILKRIFRKKHEEQ